MLNQIQAPFFGGTKRHILILGIKNAVLAVWQGAKMCRGGLEIATIPATQTTCR
jgi:hypothetical protein